MYLLTKRKLAIGIAVLAILIASNPASLNATTVTGIASHEALSKKGGLNDKPVVQDGILSVEEPPAIDIWISKLAFQESRNRSDIKILDVNGKYSYGCLQFQEETFRNYATRYGFISPSTPTESRIYDCDLQKKIAKLMIAENYSNWRAWYTSVTKTSVGMPPREA